MFPSRSNTVELSGITVELDALHKAYLSIYSEAQDQLENIDLTDIHIRRICDKLTASSTFLKLFSSTCIKDLAKAIKEADSETINADTELKGLVDALEARIWQRINGSIAAVISTMVEAKITAAVDTAIAESLNHNLTIQRGTTALDLINQLQLLATVNEQITKTTTEDNQDTTQS